MVEKWPAWKREVYNNELATSAHAVKIPLGDPVLTYNDVISNMSLEGRAELLSSVTCPLKMFYPDLPLGWCSSNCRQCWDTFLRLPYKEKDQCVEK